MHFFSPQKNPLSAILITKEIIKNAKSKDVCNARFCFSKGPYNVTATEGLIWTLPFVAQPILSYPNSFWTQRLDARARFLDLFYGETLL